jgi:para-aminobenzoate synthetase component 1
MRHGAHGQNGVLTWPLGSWADPAAVYRAVYSSSEGSFWLDSGPDALSGHSVMGASDSFVFDAPDLPIFDTLREGLAVFDSLVSPGVGFRLGWVGWLGYELRSATMGEAATRRSRHPDAAFLFVDRALVFDHASRTMSLLALGESWDGELGEWRDTIARTLSEVRDSAASLEPSGEPIPGGRPNVSWRYTDDEYLAMIAECQEAIHAGEAYQLCLTTEVSIDARPDPTATFLALRASAPAHHGGIVRIGSVALLSASPEQFLAVSPSGIVETRPIKGTRPRGGDDGDDERLRAELVNSDKERAENLMIVDLMRNDLARVCVTGSVTVPSLLAVESYSHVHQLVSTVRGALRPGLSGVDAVAACFPAGSMTGAPKLSATRILDRLERRPRGIYAGAFGYFGIDGRVDLAMVIRSIVIDENGATIGTGGGITALSVPEEELEEVRIKAAPLIAVLEQAARHLPQP